MIAPYVQAALDAPLADRPNHRDAEVRFIAERDHCCCLSAELEIHVRERDAVRELAL